MTRSMADSTNLDDCPGNSDLEASYIDRAFAQPAERWARHPKALGRIATSAQTNEGNILDVETGDAFPWEAPGWCEMRRTAGVDPSVYVEFDQWAATRTEFQLRGIPEPHWWIAWWFNPGTPLPVPAMVPIPAGAMARQFAGSALTQAHYDLSAVADYWPGVDPGPNSGEVEMQTFFIKVGDPVLWIPGPNQATQFNLACDRGVADVQLYASDVTGAPVTLDPQKSGFQLQGNEPNVRGPVQVFGSLSELGVVGPVTLGVQVTQDPLGLPDAVVALSLH
jgi:hypothetical protein